MFEQSVYVVDDDAAVRQSLSLMLRLQGYRVTTFASAECLLAWIEAAPPGCIVSDIRLPGLDGLDMLRRLNERGIGMPVILMTAFGDIPLAVQAMRAGALDFIEKPFEKAVLLDRLRDGHARLGGPSSEVARQARARSRIETLTAREREVLGGMVAGLPNKAIAYDLGISPRTVEIHRARVMEKLGARSLSGVIQIAIEAGMASASSAAS